ncbi:MAG: methionine synthase, partial [bacterium]|nr:methionine synthase [bacterium]
LDGATGTMLQSRNLGAEDFGGEQFEGCNEALNHARPDVVLDMHRAYLEAGADIIETNTFGGTPIVLAEYGLEGRTFEINQVAAQLARQAVDDYTTTERPRFVAGSMGPTTKAISVTGGVTFQDLIQIYYGQVAGLVAGGVDLLMIETCQDTRNAKAALIAADRALLEADFSCPIIVSGTIEPMGTMLAGQTAEAFVASVAHRDLLAVGLNCASGPEFMTDHIRTVHEMARCAVACYPNAGLPNEDGAYDETPASLASAMERFVDNGWVNIVGGCCGSDQHHVAALAAMVEGKKPRQVPEDRDHRSLYSGLELVEVRDDNRPLLVGERTNVIGSRKFRRLIGEEQWDEASEIARKQVRKGAQIIDVCLQTADRDEIEDVHGFYDQLIRKIKAPIMIDSTDPEAVESALTYCQGKSIINSINLEDGESRFEEICPLVRRFGAAVVVGTIDEDPEQAQAFTRERKLEVAHRSCQLLTERYGVAEQDIIFDPLTFPAASGDESYVGGAVETIEGLRLIKKEIPAAKSILGVSNVSFGLPVAAREVVNSVFLYHCTKAGLDLAIVNTQRLERFASIPERERQMAECLLFNRPFEEADADLANASDDWRQQTLEQRSAINRNNISRITEHFRAAKEMSDSPREQDLSPEQHLEWAVVEGTREGLEEALQAMLDAGNPPLEIINGPLMKGMSEVGRLFNANQLIVAEVLQSAESMKASVAFLEQFMESEMDAVRGRVVLATVKGDVHDIGKNLVEIILSNNGFRVVDLGIKVPPQKLIEACREHSPDAIGLSGLLVKSAHQMVVTAQDLATAEIDVPLLVGGAALSDKFTRGRISPAYGGSVTYCQDAMQGLDAMLRLMSSEVESAEESVSTMVEDSPGPGGVGYQATTERSSKVRLNVAPLPVPQNERRVLPRIPQLKEIWSYINLQMLIGKHLGLPGSVSRKLAERDEKALELKALVDEVQAEAESWMRVAALWRFFETQADGNSVALFEAGGDEAVEVLTFPRQAKQDGACIADLVLPARDGQRDSMAVFVVTAGEGVRDQSADAKAQGEFLRSHAIQALAVETAEATAEWLHRRIRELWGFPDPAELTMKDRFAGRYRGKRYSFGYPACPDLDGQSGIWKL